MKEENACGFESWMPCDEDCKYYFTYTRNPKYQELRQKEKVGE